MSKLIELNKTVQKYIDKHKLDISVEELFIQFEKICLLREEFDLYIETTGIKYELNKMKRNERLKEKRSIFCQWYFTKHQNNRDKKYRALLIDLSEMLFVSERTVQFDVFGETTAQSRKKASQS